MGNAGKVDPFESWAEEGKWDMIIRAAPEAVEQVVGEERGNLLFFWGKALERQNHYGEARLRLDEAIACAGKVWQCKGRMWQSVVYARLHKKGQIEEGLLARAVELLKANAQEIGTLADGSEKADLQKENAIALGRMFCDLYQDAKKNGSDKARLEDLFRQAMEAFDAADRIEPECALVPRTRSFYFMGRYEDNVEILRDCIEEHSARGEETFWPCFQLGINLLGLKRGPEALEWYERAVRELEAHRTRQHSEQGRIDHIDDKYKIYADTVELCRKLEQPHKAFYYMEVAKSRTLLERLHLSVEDERSSVPQELGQAAPLTLEDTRELLDRDTLLVNFFAGRPVQPGMREDGRAKGTAVAVGGDGEVRMFCLKVSRKELDEWVRALFRPLEKMLDYLGPQRHLGSLAGNPHALKLLRRQEKKFTAQAKQLGEVLFDPLDEEGFLQKYRHLIVVPQQRLHYVPVHALPLKDGRPLIERMSVSYLPSTSLLKHCREKARNALPGILLAGIDDPRLPNVREEIGFLEALFAAAGQPVRVLFGREATCEKVLAEMPRYGIVHLASHAEFDDDEPMESYVQLADGRLTAERIRGKGVNWLPGNRLVTLAACESGRQEIVGGDEGLGLVRAFLVSGAPAVLVSGWRVPDDSTRVLMGEFYRGVVDGLSLEGSLQRGMQVLGTGENPVGWAGFKMIGE